MSDVDSLGSYDVVSLRRDYISGAIAKGSHIQLDKKAGLPTLPDRGLKFVAEIPVTVRTDDGAETTANKYFMASHVKSNNKRVTVLLGAEQNPNHYRMGSA